MGDDKSFGSGRVQFGQKSPEPVLQLQEGVMKRLWRTFVIRPVFTWQAWRCYKAHQYLLTHDTDYRFTYVGQEIVNRRNRLYSDGVSPMDRSIPDRWSIEAELPQMSWPHKGMFDL